MIKNMVFGSIIFALISLSVFAQDNTVSTTTSSSPLKKGQILAGGKIALGNVFGASLGIIGSVELGFKENFLDNPGDFPTSLGLGASIGYSSYSNDFNSAFFSYKYSYTNIVILVGAYYHVDFLKSPKLDTYISLNGGFNVGSVSTTTTTGGEDFDINSPSIGTIVIGTAIGARYYFAPNLAVVGEVGLGLGALRAGIDFKL